MVGPKRKSLENAEDALAKQKANLELKQQELNAVTDRLARLQKNLDVKQKQKKVGPCMGGISRRLEF